jgi:hypothetical protein
MNPANNRTFGGFFHVSDKDLTLVIYPAPHVLVKAYIKRGPIALWPIRSPPHGGIPLAACWPGCSGAK